MGGSSCASEGGRRWVVPRDCVSEGGRRWVVPRVLQREGEGGFCEGLGQCLKSGSVHWIKKVYMYCTGYLYVN